MITGGLGFIGSNLAIRLVELGADVLLVDSLIPDAGGNFANIEPVKDRLRVNVADIRQASTMNYLVRGQDVIFNLAGQVSHIDSMRDPHTDLEVNCRAQLTLLEACRHHNPGAKVVFAGTRQVYGRPDALPVTEQHLVRPTDVNGINKVAGEYYHLVYNNVFGVRACSLRLTNVYGPRQLIRHNRQGFIGWFIRLALDRREIQIFGDGSQIRDFVYVDDVADAFLRAGATDAVNGEVFNVGGNEHWTHADLVALLVTLADGGVLPLRRVAAREEGHRHRQLLRRLVEVPGGDRLDAGGAAARGARADPGVLPRPLRRLRCARGASCRSAEPRGDVVSTAAVRVPFNALRPGDDRAAIDAAIARVLDSGWFVLGPEVAAFEAEFAAATGAGHAVGVNTGTDAIALALRALDIGPGDEVITAPLSAAYTALAIDMTGARPVFADIDPSRLTLDAAAVDAAVTPRTRADRPGAPLRPAGGHGRDGARRRAPRARRGRGRLPGAPGDRRRTAGGPRLGGRGLQLLSRPRTSARSATAAR